MNARSPNFSLVRGINRPRPSCSLLADRRMYRTTVGPAVYINVTYITLTDNIVFADRTAAIIIFLAFFYSFPLVAN